MSDFWVGLIAFLVVWVPLAEIWRQATGSKNVLPLFWGALIAQLAFAAKIIATGSVL